jgi:hypothetical protein
MDICHGRPCHCFWLYLLLIALAIQGVTPDAQDLASLNSLLVLCPSLIEVENLAGNDALPDDVCGPAQPEVIGFFGDRGEFGGLVRLPNYSMNAFLTLATPIAARRASSGCETDRRFDDLINRLCRLQC